MTKTFCVLPWIHLDLQSGIDVPGINPCCLFKWNHLEEVDSNFYRHSDIKQHGLQSAVNQNAFNSIRQDMLDGKHIKGCYKCYDHEKIGKASMRENMNEYFSIDQNTLTNSFDSAQYIEISLDNTCNLECKMCSSRYSTKLRRRDKILNYTVEPNEVYDIDMLDTINLDNIKLVKILGGEPLLSKNHLPLLNKFPNISGVTLLYNTNATIIPNQETIDKMRQAKKLNFIISCDGIYKYNDYQRWGSKFENIIENSIKIQSLFDNIESFVYLNVFTLLNLNSYTETKKWFNDKNYVHSSEWEHGGVLSAWHAPDWYEEWILTKNDHPEVRNYFKRRKYNPEMWNKFLNLIEVTDNMYGTRLEDYNPELAEQLHKHCNK